MPARSGIAVDPGATARPGTARSLGIALLALTALACWASAALFDPAGGTDDLLATGATLAAMSFGGAGLSLYLLDRGRTRAWAAWLWFATALLSLVILVASSFASHLTG